MKMIYLLTHNILIDMKKLFFLPAIIACLFLSAVATGQNRGDFERDMPTVEEMIDFECKKLTKRLLLDDATANKFVKTYTEYRKEFISIKDKYPILRTCFNKDEILTDEQIELKIESLFAQGKDMIAVREKYYKEFRKFLTPRQIDVVFESERHRFHKFKKEGDRRKGGKPKRRNTTD